MSGSFVPGEDPMRSYRIANLEKSKSRSPVGGPDWWYFHTRLQLLRGDETVANDGAVPAQAVLSPKTEPWAL
jgi:hypothetical protein